MSPTPGSRFGSYEILSLLGVGGTGEVYRARDTRLKRDVALKFLSEPFAGDTERLARFQREAELLATLNHPNIAIIYGLEDPRDSSGPAAATALVMELVEGPTLDEHLKANADQQQKLLLKEIVDIALQIAEALESAHDRGVIHRDLKPANIKLTASGQVKVLDFGLAKLAEPAGLGSGPAGLTHSPTLSMQATFAGMILGTAAYMSPEQARGKIVDKRTDIWAFGCVLFEMLAGKRAFDGEDITDAIASVVAREPDWAALPPDLPAQLRLLLQRCLEKDPRKRIGDISTARFLMTETIAPATTAVAPSADAGASSGINEPKARRRTFLFTGVGLATGAVLAGLATWMTMRAPIETGKIAVLDLKTGQRKILLRGGSSAEYVETGHLVYAAGGTLRAVRFDPVRLEVLSDPVPVTDQVMTSGTGAANFAVSRNGTLVYAPGSAGSATLGGGAQRSLVWISRQGREEPLKTPIRAYTVPRLSPDNTRLALDIRDQENDIWIWEFARATLTRLTFSPAADIFPVWTPDARRIAFGSARTGVMSLYWRAADGTGADEPLTRSSSIVVPTSFSPDGKTLAVMQGVPGRNQDISLVRMDDPAGKRPLEPLISTTFGEQGAEVSPDGRWIAYYSNESGQDEVYVRPFPRIDAGRWQISTGGGTRPAWASSGRELFYLAGGSMMAVPVQTTPNFSAGNPVKLFEGQFYAAQNARMYDVSKDAQRFLMIKTTIATTAESGTQPSMVVVEHWAEELKARVPLR